VRLGARQQVLGRHAVAPPGRHLVLALGVEVLERRAGVLERARRDVHRGAAEALLVNALARVERGPRQAHNALAVRRAPVDELAVAVFRLHGAARRGALAQR
jgi:hypothetical protein